MKFFLFVFLFFICFLPVTFSQDTNNPEEIDVNAIMASLEAEDFFGRKILHTPLELILKSGLVYYRAIAIKLLEQKTAQSKYQGAFADFSPQLTTSFSNEKTTPNTLTQNNSSTTFSIANNNIFSTTFSQKIPVGIRYGISINATDINSSTYQLQNNDTSLSTERKSNLVSTTFDFNIPLAQGLGAVNTLGIRRNFITSKEEEKETLNEALFFFQIFIEVYWQLKQVYAMYEVQNEKVLLSEKLYQENKLRQDIGAGDSLQVVSSFNTYQNDKITLNNIWNTIVDINEQVKDTFDLLELPSFLYPADDFPLEKLSEDANYYLEKMIKTHPNFLSLEIARSRNEADSIESKNEDKADIDLNLRYSQIGIGLDRTQALDNLSVTELDSYKVELAWKIPFGNKTAKSKKDEVLYKKLILDKQLSSIKSSAKLAIRKRLRDLESKLLEIDILKESLKVTEENFQREKIKYDNGSSTSLILQEIQTELVNNKFFLITAKKDYAILYSQMLIDTGDIFDYYHIPNISIKK